MSVELLFEARATNGRTGLAVVGPAATAWPAEGALRPVGRAAGVDTWAIEPGQTQTWVLPVLGAVRVHGGATVVATEGLQSGREATLLLLGREAVVEIFGYDRRDSRVAAYVDGVERDIPAPVLAAMGLLKAGGKLVEVAPPPSLDGPMAAAFARLRG